MWLERITAWFPYWALAAVGAAFWQPEWFAPMRGAIVWLLGVVMFGMGMSLRAENFAEVLRRPKIVALGVAMQYLLMPLIAWGLMHALSLPAMIGAGLVLVGSCPGGTASNVICYLARGDVALSITLTAVSTLLAVIATPLLTWWYIGQSVPVPVWDMLLSILKIVIAPVVVGVWLNQTWGAHLGAVKRVFPLVSVLAIAWIIAIIVALNRGQLAALAGWVVAAVMLHNLFGLGAGYGIARLLGMDTRTSRTLAIEVGMQNSGLGVALAHQYFSPAAALPGAWFSVWHNLSGAWLARRWARGGARDE